jgi:hypothetical protein
MKAFVCVFAIAFILITMSCAAINLFDRDTQPVPTWIVTQNGQAEYSKALKQWRGHNISNYQITTDVFSSMLAPPCSVKATLTVRENNLIATSEIVTPIPIQMPDGSVMHNPECYVYENYLVANQFEFVEKLLTGQLPYSWNVKFDQEYGNITELTYATDGESLKIMKYFDFAPK